MTKRDENLRGAVNSSDPMQKAIEQLDEKFERYSKKLDEKFEDVMTSVDTKISKFSNFLTTE